MEIHFNGPQISGFEGMSECKINAKILGNDEFFFGNANKIF